jgi:hypothetical protein
VDVEGVTDVPVVGTVDGDGLRRPGGRTPHPGAVVTSDFWLTLSDCDPSRGTAAFIDDVGSPSREQSERDEQADCDMLQPVPAMTANVGWGAQCWARSTVLGPLSAVEVASCGRP